MTAFSFDFLNPFSTANFHELSLCRYQRSTSAISLGEFYLASVFLSTPKFLGQNLLLFINPKNEIL